MLHCGFHCSDGAFGITDMLESEAVTSRKRPDDAVDRLKGRMHLPGPGSGLHLLWT